MRQHIRFYKWYEKVSDRIPAEMKPERIEMCRERREPINAHTILCQVGSAVIYVVK